MKTHQEFYEELFEDILKKEYNEEPTAGHPRLYKTPKDLALKAVEYFTRQEELDRPITFEGLRLYCKFWSPKSFYDYKETQQYHDDFAKVVEIIQLIIYNFNTEKLYSGKFPGAKFVLNCNYGWTTTERQIIQNDTVNVSIGKKNPEAEE
jgi:hypothetical protein